MNQTTQPPTDATALDRSDGPIEYTRPVHTPQRVPGGVPDPDVGRIDPAVYPELAPRQPVAPREPDPRGDSGNTPGFHVGEPARCPHTTASGAPCGCAWFAQVVPLSVGPRRLERVPGSAPLWRCEACGTLYQEHPSNTLDEVRFDTEGRLYRPAAS
jgi:hypothetical protein